MATQTQRKLHPLILAATVSLTVFSLLGSAAIAGLLRCNCAGYTDEHARTAPTYSFKARPMDHTGRKIALFIPRYAIGDPVRVAHGRTLRI